MDKARAYVENWKEAYKNNPGLLLFGDVGTGKSFFAGCIANALLDRDVPVLMTNFPTIDVYKRQVLYHVTKQQNIFRDARMALCRPGAFLSLWSRNIGSAWPELYPRCRCSWNRFSVL